MRMTRAALRAQEAEDELQTQIEVKLREQGLSSQSHDNNSTPLIHEDMEDETSYSSNGNTPRDPDNIQENNSIRLALRDITTENYPTAGLSTVAIDGSKVSVIDTEVEEHEMKSIKKAKSKKGRKVAPKKKDVVVEEQELQSPESQSEEFTNISESFTPSNNSFKAMKPTTEVEDVRENIDQDQHITPQPDSLIEDNGSTQQGSEIETSTTYEADVSQETNELAPKTPSKPTETLSKTPRFNPDIHLPLEPTLDLPSENTEDSFVDSIKTRSPSKFSQSFLTSQSQEQSYVATGTPLARTPARKPSQTLSPSPQRIEDSVEAIDALEDAIEKFAEDLPLIESLPLESPVRSRRTPARTPAKMPVKLSAGTPAKITAQTTVKTPARAPAKTPLKNKTPPSETNMVKTPQTSKDKLLSAKRDTVKERVKAIESKPTPAPHRRATSVHVLKKDAPEVKSTLKSKHMATKSVPTISAVAPSTMSFSNSPVKQAANVPKKRVPSGGALVTSKPGFVPAKSNKPTTTSNFSLPGEVIAAKLKAQREERVKREESEAEKKASFKARPAPARTARPSVMPRENKASAARLGVRQASGENKENVAPARSASGPTTVKTRTVSASTSATKPVNSATVANSSVRRTTIAPKASSTVESRKSMAVTMSATTQSSNPRITSLSSGLPSTITKADAVQQKLKGKEVYGRLKGSLQQMEEEKKAKEEAAKKARAEAAERGRLASREWAEKQKKKMAATATTKGEGESIKVVEIST